MARPSSAWFACSGLAFSFLQCPLDDWGTPPGSVCSGPEVSLTPIAAGASLAGWWEAELQDDKASLERPALWHFIRLDAFNHPRALTDSEPSRFEQRGGQNFFGCQRYLEYPLVVGGENVSPSFERHSVQEPTGCDVVERERVVSPDSRRILLRTSQEGNTICLHYQSYRHYPPRSQHEKGKTWFSNYCFGYDAVQDQLELSYWRDDALPERLRYRRYRAQGSKDQGSTQMTFAPTESS